MLPSMAPFSVENFSANTATSLSILSCTFSSLFSVISVLFAELLSLVPQAVAVRARKADSTRVFRIVFISFPFSIVK